jgi:hypothetical protein
MAVAVCSPCDRYYVVEIWEATPPRCPRCHQPLRLARSEETQSRLHRPLTHDDAPHIKPLPARHSAGPDPGSAGQSQAGEPSGSDWIDGLAVHAGDILRESRRRREEMAGRLKQVRYLRHQLMDLVDELQRTVERSGGGSPPLERGPSGSEAGLSPR